MSVVATKLEPEEISIDTQPSMKYSNSSPTMSDVGCGCLFWFVGAIVICWFILNDPFF